MSILPGASQELTFVRLQVALGRLLGSPRHCTTPVQPRMHSGFSTPLLHSSCRGACRTDTQALETGAINHVYPWRPEGNSGCSQSVPLFGFQKPSCVSAGDAGLFLLALRGASWDCVSYQDFYLQGGCCSQACAVCKQRGTTPSCLLLPQEL